MCFQIVKAADNSAGTQVQFSGLLMVYFVVHTRRSSSQRIGSLELGDSTRAKHGLHQ